MEIFFTSKITVENHFEKMVNIHLRKSRSWPLLKLKMSSADINVPWTYFNDNEKLLILHVLRRDAVLRQKELLHIRRLKAELQFLRKRGALKASDDVRPSQTVDRDHSRSCARCRIGLGRIINRGALCKSCRQRVCKACREYNLRGTDWVCTVCYKNATLEAVSGEWMNTFIRRPSRRRHSKDYVAPGDIIARGIRRSWTISNPSSSKEDTLSPQLSGYNTLATPSKATEEDDRITPDENRPPPLLWEPRDPPLQYSVPRLENNSKQSKEHVRIGPRRSASLSQADNVLLDGKMLPRVKSQQPRPSKNDESNNAAKYQEYYEAKYEQPVKYDIPLRTDDYKSSRHGLGVKYEEYAKDKYGQSKPNLRSHSDDRSRIRSKPMKEGIDIDTLWKSRWRSSSPPPLVEDWVPIKPPHLAWAKAIPVEAVDDRRKFREEPTNPKNRNTINIEPIPRSVSGDMIYLERDPDALFLHQRTLSIDRGMSNNGMNYKTYEEELRDYQGRTCSVDRLANRSRPRNIRMGTLSHFGRSVPSSLERRHSEASSKRRESDSSSSSTTRNRRGSHQSTADMNISTSSANSSEITRVTASDFPLEYGREKHKIPRFEPQQSVTKGRNVNRIYIEGHPEDVPPNNGNQIRVTLTDTRSLKRPPKLEERSSLPQQSVESATMPRMSRRTDRENAGTTSVYLETPPTVRQDAYVQLDHLETKKMENKGNRSDGEGDTNGRDYDVEPITGAIFRKVSSRKADSCESDTGFPSSPSATKWMSSSPKSKRRSSKTIQDRKTYMVRDSTMEAPLIYSETCETFREEHNNSLIRPCDNAMQDVAVQTNTSVSEEERSDFDGGHEEIGTESDLHSPSHFEERRSCIQSEVSSALPYHSDTASDIVLDANKIVPEGDDYKIVFISSDSSKSSLEGSFDASDQSPLHSRRPSSINESETAGFIDESDWDFFASEGRNRQKKSRGTKVKLSHLHTSRNSSSDESKVFRPTTNMRPLRTKQVENDGRSSTLSSITSLENNSPRTFLIDDFNYSWDQREDANVKVGEQQRSIRTPPTGSSGVSVEESVGHVTYVTREVQTDIPMDDLDFEPADRRSNISPTRSMEEWETMSHIRCSRVSTPACNNNSKYCFSDDHDNFVPIWKVPPSSRSSTHSLHTLLSTCLEGPETSLPLENSHHYSGLDDSNVIVGSIISRLHDPYFPFVEAPGGGSFTDSPDANYYLATKEYKQAIRNRYFNRSDSKRSSGERSMEELNFHDHILATSNLANDASGFISSLYSPDGVALPGFQEYREQILTEIQAYTAKGDWNLVAASDVGHFHCEPDNTSCFTPFQSDRNSSAFWHETNSSALKKGALSRSKLGNYRVRPTGSRTVPKSVKRWRLNDSEEENSTPLPSSRQSNTKSIVDFHSESGENVQKLSENVDDRPNPPTQCLESCGNYCTPELNLSRESNESSSRNCNASNRVDFSLSYDRDLNVDAIKIRATTEKNSDLITETSKNIKCNINQLSNQNTRAAFVGAQRANVKEKIANSQKGEFSRLGPEPSSIDRRPDESASGNSEFCRSETHLSVPDLEKRGPQLVRLKNSAATAPSIFSPAAAGSLDSSTVAQYTAVAKTHTTCSASPFTLWKQREKASLESHHHLVNATKDNRDIVSRPIHLYLALSRQSSVVSMEEDTCFPVTNIASNMADYAENRVSQSEPLPSGLADGYLNVVSQLSHNESVTQNETGIEQLQLKGQNEQQTSTAGACSQEGRFSHVKSSPDNNKHSLLENSIQTTEQSTVQNINAPTETTCVQTATLLSTSLVLARPPSPQAKADDTLKESSQVSCSPGVAINHSGNSSKFNLSEPNCETNLTIDSIQTVEANTVLCHSDSQEPTGSGESGTSETSSPTLKKSATNLVSDPLGESLKPNTSECLSDIIQAKETIAEKNDFIEVNVDAETELASVNIPSDSLLSTRHRGSLDQDSIQHSNSDKEVEEGGEEFAADTVDKSASLLLDSSENRLGENSTEKSSGQSSVENEESLMSRFEVTRAKTPELRSNTPDRVHRRLLSDSDVPTSGDEGESLAFDTDSQQDTIVEGHVFYQDLRQYAMKQSLALSRKDASLSPTPPPVSSILDVNDSQQSDTDSSSSKTDSSHKRSSFPASPVPSDGRLTPRRSQGQYTSYVLITQEQSEMRTKENVISDDESRVTVTVPQPTSENPTAAVCVVEIPARDSNWQESHVEESDSEPLDTSEANEESGSCVTVSGNGVLTDHDIEEDATTDDDTPTEQGEGSSNLAKYFTLALESGYSATRKQPIVYRNPERNRSSSPDPFSDDQEVDSSIDHPIPENEDGESLASEEPVSLDAGEADPIHYESDPSERLDSIDDAESNYSESVSSGDEAYFDREEELRGYNRAIDFTLHTILEESCEESDGERRSRTEQLNTRSDPSELEKYFTFGLGGDVALQDGGSDGKRRTSFANEESEYSDTFSETSSSVYSEGLDSVERSAGEEELDIDPVELASSRLEKYFMTGFLGLEPGQYPFAVSGVPGNGSDGSESVGSDSEGHPSPEQRRRKVMKARGLRQQASSHSGFVERGRSSSERKENASTDAPPTSLSELANDTEVDSIDPEKIQNENRSGFTSPASELSSSEEEEIVFEKTDGQFDTIKRRKKKRNTNDHDLERPDKKLVEMIVPTIEENVVVYNSSLEQVVPDLSLQKKTDVQTEAQEGNSDNQSPSNETPTEEVNAGLDPNCPRKYQSRDSGFVGSCDDLLSESPSQKEIRRRLSSESGSSDADGEKHNVPQNGSAMYDVVIESNKPDEGDTKSSKSVGSSGSSGDHCGSLTSTSQSSKSGGKLSRKDSFNNWSSDEETNLMMNKMRAFFRNMVSNNGGKGDENGQKVKPPQLVAFENELTRLMKSVPGINDQQVKEIVEYLSSEDTWSDSYDSSDYTSSDLEGAYAVLDPTVPELDIKSDLQQQISASCQEIIQKFDLARSPEGSHPKIDTIGSNAWLPVGEDASNSLNRETAFVYQRLINSLMRLNNGSKNSSTGNSTTENATESTTPTQTTPHSSPPMIAKVIQHIGNRLVALMHEVSASSDTTSHSGSLDEDAHSTGRMKEMRLTQHFEPVTSSPRMTKIGRLFLNKDHNSGNDKNSLSTSIDSEDTPTDTEQSPDSDDSRTRDRKKSGDTSGIKFGFETLHTYEKRMSSLPSHLGSEPRNREDFRGYASLESAAENRSVIGGSRSLKARLAERARTLEAERRRVAEEKKLVEEDNGDEDGADEDRFYKKERKLPRFSLFRTSRETREALQSSSSGVSDIAEEKEDEFSGWRSSFESAIAADSRTKLSLEAKRRSAGSASSSELFASSELLDRDSRRVRASGHSSKFSLPNLLERDVRMAKERERERERSASSDVLLSTSPIASDTMLSVIDQQEDEETEWDRLVVTRLSSKRRSSVPDTREERTGDREESRSTTLPRSATGLNTTETETDLGSSSPSISVSTAGVKKSLNLLLNNSTNSASGSSLNTSVDTPVKSARYRPPGFQSQIQTTPRAPQRSPSVPGLEGKHDTSRWGNTSLSNRKNIRSMLADERKPTTSSPSFVREGLRTSVTSAASGESISSVSVTDTNDDNELSVPATKPRSSSLSALGTRSDSLASVYSAAGEARYGTVAVKGEVQFGLHYNYRQTSLEVFVKQCRDLAPVDIKRNRSDPYVKVYLLPDRSKGGKRKTKVKKHTLCPIFEEHLKFATTLADLENRTLWLTVWHSDMFGRNDFLGEVTLPLAGRIFDDPTPHWYQLQERSEALDDSSFIPLHRGDIIIALKYVPAESSSFKKGKKSKGALHVMIKEAKGLIPLRPNGNIDALCKGALLPEKGRTTKNKTNICRRTANPVWNCTFIFDDITHQELTERALDLSIWNHDRLASKEFLGGVRLSLGTGLYQDKPVDWMDAVGKEITLWQSVIERANLWFEGSLPLRTTTGRPVGE